MDGCDLIDAIGVRTAEDEAVVYIAVHGADEGHGDAVGGGRRVAGLEAVEAALRPEMLQIADINKTSVCHLARKMRKELKERRVRKLTVVYSKELPHKPVGEGHAPGSISFVPPVSGMMMAGYVVRALLKENGIG